MDRRRERLLPVPRWPTADEAAAGRWFQPLRLGPVTAEARTWVPAMVPWRSNEEGYVTPEVIAWYERFARGEPGVLVVEATGIRDVPSGPLLRAGHDRYMEGLSRLVEAVRRASGGRTRLFIQLIDFLAIKRRPTKEAFFNRFLRVDAGLRARAASVLGEPALAGAPEPGLRARLLGVDDALLAELLPARELESYRMGHRERVTDLHLPHIRELPRTLPPLFAAAARRCLEAGFDGVELHCAHAYTLASFLSALNTREDGYGTTREGRLRLPLEVYAATRAEVGTKLALGCRFLSDEVVEGGSTGGDTAQFGVAFARAGMDFLSLSRGGKFEDARQPKVGAAAYPYTGPSGHACMPTAMLPPPGPWGRNLPFAADIRRAVRDAGFDTPIIACGGIATFQQAEEALARGDADAVGAARQCLADPDFFKKVKLGRGEEVRRCLFTNYCEGLDQAHKAVTCQLWDRGAFPDDAEVGRSPDGRRLTAPPWEA